MNMMKSSLFFSSVIILVFFLSVAAGDETISVEDDVEKCVYTLYVKTGFFFIAGTDSNISMTLSDADGKSVGIPNLEDWGLMGPKHNYFEMGNLDVFSGKGPCIATPICRLSITSNGSGDNQGWYCEYVQVVSTGPHINCSQSIFNVEQWLGTYVSPGQQITTIIIDGCAATTTTTNNNHARKNIGVSFVVGKHLHHHVGFPPQRSPLSSSPLAASH